MALAIKKLLPVVVVVFALLLAAPASPSTGTHSTTMVATAYCLSGHTATGTSVHYGTIAVYPRQIRLGTRLYVSGYGQGRAEDTGSAIGWGHLDLWFPSCSQAMRWGRRSVRVTIFN